jgi:hypothetical protein
VFDPVLDAISFRGEEELLIEAMRKNRGDRVETIRLQAKLLALRRASTPEQQSTLPPALPVGMSLDALTGWVMERCGLAESGRRPVLAPALRTVLERAELAARPQCAAEMAAAWSQYVRGMQRWGPKKFFSEGHWQHPASWPRDERVFDPCAPRVGVMA